jgi:hypothetical protein
MSQSPLLYQLQQVDSQTDQAHQRLHAIAQALENDATLRQAATHADEAQKALRNAQKALRQAEEMVKAQQIKIEVTEANLYGGKVRNPKELQDLQSEAAALKRYLETLEERQLEQMMAVEQAEAEQTQAQANFQDTQARVSEQQAGLKGEQTALQQNVERLRIERQAVVTSLAADVVAHYEQLRQQRRGVAVARINNRSCSACGSTINTAVAQAAASASQLSHCPTCGRILYAG